MKQKFKYILILPILVILFGLTTTTQASPANPNEPCSYTAPSTVPNNPPCVSAFIPGTNTPAPVDTSYHLLAPIPNVGETFDPTNKKALGVYLNQMIKIFIGICAVLAVIMIVMGGIEYMTSELVSSKESGQEKIKDALLGLLIALGSYALLNTINPDLLKADIEIGSADVTVNLISNSIYDKPMTATNIARCTPVTSGPCATANLSIFGAKAEGMSKICNIESGGNASAASGTDIGTDGTVFSFGLLQINLLANGSIVKDSSGNSCANLFERSDGSPIVGGNYIQTNSSGRRFYDAKLKSGMQAKYNDCKNTLLNPTKNIQVAGILYQQGATSFNNPMFAWKGDMGICSSAFN